jgi:hypothetical protein
MTRTPDKEKRAQGFGAHCPAPSTLPAVFSYVLLLAIILIEYAFFQNFVLAEISPFFPDTYDQAVYLLRAYELYESLVKESGALAKSFLLLKEIIAPNHPQGKLLPILANLLFLTDGPSRLNALLVNFALFAALQTAMFYTIKRISGRYSIAFMALATLLSITFPFSAVGNIYDFRMDFAAFATYGIFASVVVCSNAFLSRRWSLAVMITAAFMLLLRQPYYRISRDSLLPPAPCPYSDISHGQRRSPA